jgi:hypothetical protein
MQLSAPAGMADTTAGTGGAATTLVLVSGAGAAALVSAGDLGLDLDGAGVWVGLPTGATLIPPRIIIPIRAGVFRRGLLQRLIRRHIPARIPTTIHLPFTQACLDPIRPPKTI